MGDEFSDTSTDVSSDVGMDTNSDVDTGADVSADEGLDTESDIDTEADEGLDTSSDMDTEAAEGLDTSSDVDTETDEGTDEGLDTEPDSDTGEDVTEDGELDTDSETDTDTETDVSADDGLDIETGTDEVSEEEDSENKEVEEDTDEVPEEEDSENKEVEEDSENKEVEEDTDEVPEEEDSENKEVEEENGETSETPEQDELDGPEKSNDTDDVANGDDSNLDDEGGNGDKVIERDREIVPDKELYNDTEIRDNINDINIDKPQMSDTPIYDTPIFVTNFSSSDTKSERNVNNNSDMKNSNETSNKKGFKDIIKGLFGGKKKEKPEDAPIDVNNDNEENDPRQDFINGLGGYVNHEPNLDDANYDQNKKPKPWDHGQREIGNDDPRWKDAISDTENENTKMNANNINRAETITENRETQTDASQAVNEGVFGGIFLSKEERNARRLESRINDSNENLKDTQETINQFFEEENIENYLSNKDRFEAKKKIPLSDTVRNMGYQEAEETYNSMSRDKYSKNILGFNNGEKSYVIVEGKDDRQIKHTTIHENIHQMSANDVYLAENDIITRRGISINGQDTGINEGITEFYTKRAMKDEYQEDNVAYSPNVRRTEQLERIVGKGNLYKAYFENQPGIIINEFEQNFGSAGKEIWKKYSKFCDLAVESNDEYVRTVANQEADKILQKLETLKIVNGRKI